MPRRRLGPRPDPLGTEALVLRRIPYGETDLVLHFATRALGRVSGFAKAARRSRRRFPSGFPTFALLEIHLGPPSRADALRPVLDAVVLRPHLPLAADLARFAAGGLLLEIAREALPEQHPEPRAFDALAAYLGELTEAPFSWGGLLAAELRLLAPLGSAPQLARCLSCDTPAPPGRAALFDPRRGGIVCRRCGGAPIALAGDARELMRAALAPADGPPPPAARPAALRDAQRALLAFLEQQFGRRFTSARLLEEAAG